MSFNSSKDSGFPNGYDYYSPGSEITAKNRLQTPAGFNTSAPSAALDKHQDPQTTAPIGVPGTSYTPHSSDQIFTTVGGHAVIMGNSPGNETIRVQSKAGAAIELSDDGSIRVVSSGGLYLSINGDNQIVLQGDYAITTSGAMKFKAGSVIFDTNEMIMNVHGDMTTYVDGDVNQEVMGDKHSYVVGDKSDMTGGNERKTIAGDYRDQVLGQRKIETGSDQQNLTKGSYLVSSVGQMVNMTNNNMISSAIGSYSLTSKGNTSFSTQSNMLVSAAADATIGSKASVNIIGDTGVNVSSNASVQMTSKTDFKIDSSATVYLTGGTNIDGYAPRIDWNKASRSPASITSAPGVGIPVSATYPQLPDKELILDSMSDFVATNGEIDNIVTAEQVRMLYGESEVDSQVPDAVLNRLAEKGIEFPPKTFGSIITIVNTDNIKSNISDTQDGWNPGVA